MCAVIGIYGHHEAATLAYLGLYAMQHRGQEGAGIVSSDGRSMFHYKGTGLVHSIFTEAHLAYLCGRNAIGHTRYSTSGGTGLNNVQPVVARKNDGGIVALAHNGNLTNARTLRRELECFGAELHTSADTELIARLIADSPKHTLADRIAEACEDIEGAYSFVALDKKSLVAARDPHGFRPLVLGVFQDGGWVVASETCALDQINAQFVREIAPGEIVELRADGETRCTYTKQATQPRPCVFELMYFLRPDSEWLGTAGQIFRNALGRQLAREAPAPDGADVVIPVPDSGIPAALGFSQASLIPFSMGLVRNHYVGRTFIEPDQSIRDFGVKVKFNPVRKVVDGKRVVVVDDSIVRGTTSRKLVRMLRDAGAAEVHLRIAAPPTAHPCFHGIDMPTYAELIAHRHGRNSAAICASLKADTLAYLSEAGLLAVAREMTTSQTYCTACFDGKYHTKIEP